MPLPVLREADFGVKVLRALPSGLKEGEAIDVVAVHGMGAHPDHTWAGIIDPTMDKTKPENYVNWLIDENLLPSVLPSARIMRFGYASDWFGENMVKTRASKIGQKLLKGLVRARKDVSQRPMILIAHSFGGLVVLSMLLDAANASTASWNHIHHSTKGLVFFGTPFRGAHRSLSLGEVLLLAEHGAVSANTENLTDLQAGAGSLIDLVDGYLTSAKDFVDRDVVCVYEEKETNVAALVNRATSKKVLLVDESSGTLDGSIKISRPCDHFEINKFGNAGSETWEELAEALLEIKAKAQRPEFEPDSLLTGGVAGQESVEDRNINRQAPHNTFAGSMNNNKNVLQGNAFGGIGNVSFS